MDRQIQRVMFSSKSGSWRTPQELFNQLDEEFHFDLDVCADKDHKLAPMENFVGNDGLERSWQGHTCFMNPPYGREIVKWIEKAVAEIYLSKHNFGPNVIGADWRKTIVVGLLPARTDTNWFWNYILECDFEIRLIRGRLKFNKRGYHNSAPFPSMIVVFQ